MPAIKQTLKEMDIDYQALELIRQKAGIYLYRVISGSHSVVLKYFEHESDRREIINYQILQSLGIPTLQLIRTTEQAILIEDISTSPVFRLGQADDIHDLEVISALARWYRTLHEQGKNITGKKLNLYSETSCLTQENISQIAEKSQTMHHPVWQLIQDSLDQIVVLLANQNHTLTYNDFDASNLIVAKDKSQALMFDYNLLGQGLAYSDIRNVTWSMNKKATDTFLSIYGDINPIEKVIDDVTSPLVTLIFAYQRPTFPSWGQSILDQVLGGQLEQAIRDLF